MSDPSVATDQPARGPQPGSGLGAEGHVTHTHRGAVDEDLDRMSREQLMVEVRKLRAGIRAHHDSTGHELCWHHPALWALLPERTDPVQRCRPGQRFSAVVCASESRSTHNYGTGEHDSGVPKDLATRAHVTGREPPRAAQAACGAAWGKRTSSSCSRSCASWNERNPLGATCRT